MLMPINSTVAKVALIQYTSRQIEYDSLKRRMDLEPWLAGYVAGKLRYNYNPRNSILTIRLPSTVHDRFMYLFATQIEYQISAAFIQHASRPVLAQLLASLIAGSTSDVFLDREGRHKRSPNFGFWYKKISTPALVIESGPSQTFKSLRGAAHEYIKGSLGGCKFVIGFNLRYGRDNDQDRIHVWESFLDQEERTLTVRSTLNATFRGSDAIGAELVLPIGVFVPNRVLDSLQVSEADRQVPLIIFDFATLREYLNQLDKEMKDREQDWAEVWQEPLPPGFRVAEDSESSEECLSRSDEDLIAAQEEAVQGALDQQDPDYTLWK